MSAPQSPAKGEVERLRELVIDQLVEEGRAKHRTLNDEQQDAADSEARTFYRKVIDRYRAALSTPPAQSGDGLTERQRDNLAMALSYREGPRQTVLTPDTSKGVDVRDEEQAANDRNLIKRLSEGASDIRTISQAMVRLQTLTAWAYGPNGIRWYTDQLSALRASQPAGMVLNALKAERAKPIQGPEHGAWDRGRRAGLDDAIRIATRLTAAQAGTEK